MFDDYGSRFRTETPDPNGGFYLLLFLAILLLIVAACRGTEWLGGILRRRREHYHSAEQVERRRQEREEAYRAARSASAERQARAYYRKHADLLAEECPPELFESLLRSHHPDGVSPEAAWDAARDIIAHLQPIVRRGLAQRAERREEVETLNRQIQSLHRQIRRVRAGTSMRRASAPKSTISNCRSAI